MVNRLSPFGLYTFEPTFHPSKVKSSLRQRRVIHQNLETINYFFLGGGNEVMLTYLIFDAGHIAHLRTDPLAAGESEGGQPRKRPPPREKREERKLKRIPHNLT